MTVEPDVVRRKLLEINEATAHLRAWRPVTVERLESDQQLRWAKRLLAQGVLSAATAERLKGLAGFRNVLVHEYADIDPSRLVTGLDRLGDLDAFVADVERWLQARGG